MSAVIPLIGKHLEPLPEMPNDPFDAFFGGWTACETPFGVSFGFVKADKRLADLVGIKSRQAFLDYLFGLGEFAYVTIRLEKVMPLNQYFLICEKHPSMIAMTKTRREEGIYNDNAGYSVARFSKNNPYHVKRLKKLWRHFCDKEKFHSWLIRRMQTKLSAFAEQDRIDQFPLNKSTEEPAALIEVFLRNPHHLEDRESDINWNALFHPILALFHNGKGDLTPGKEDQEIFFEDMAFACNEYFGFWSPEFEEKIKKLYKETIVNTLKMHGSRDFDVRFPRPAKLQLVKSR